MILTASSSEPSLKLTNKKAGTEVVPTALYYTFSVKNVGNKKVGNEVEPLTFKI